MGSVIRRAVLAAGISVLLGACSSGDSPVNKVEYAVQGVYSAVLSPDSRYAVVGSIQHGGSLWDSTRHERLYNWNHKEGSYSNLVAADFSPDSQYAVTVGQQTMVLWQVSDGQPHWFWSSPAEVLDAALAPTGTFALLGLVNHTAVYFDIKNGGVKQTLIHEGRVSAVDLSDDGRLGLTGSDNNFARLWDMQSGQELRSIAHENDVNTVALSPSGRYAFSASQLDRAFIWDTDSGEILHTLSGDEGFLPKRLSYTAAAFSPNSDQLLTGNTGGIVQLWDVREGRELKRWQVYLRDSFRPTSATVFAVAFSNDGYTAISANGYTNELR